MTHLKKIVLAAVIIALASTPALAKRPGGEGDFRHYGKMHQNFEMLKVALDLTPQQQEEIQQIIAKKKESTMPLRTQVHENKDALRKIMDKEVLNESQLQVLMQEKANLQTEMMIEKHELKTKIDALLTPEQQLKHAELRKLRMERKGQRRFAKGQDI